MKKASILACVLLFVAVAAFAQTPSRPPLTREALAAILGLPVASSCATQPSGVRKVAKRPGILPTKSLCSATANCQFGLYVASCSSNTSTSSCVAVDSNCVAGEPGHVVCDGVTTSCPACCTGHPLSVEYRCCECELTGDCEACCRCDGGSIGQCAIQCS